MEKGWCSFSDFKSLWGVSDQDISGFVMKGLLKPYKRLGNKNAIDIQYELPNRNQPLNEIESEIRNNLVVLKNGDPIISGGKINYGVVHRRSKEIIIDKQIRQTSGSISSYRLPTEQEIKNLSKFLYEAQPVGYYIPVPAVRVRGSYFYFSLSEKGKHPDVSNLSFRTEDVNRFAAENCFPILCAPDEEQTTAKEQQRQALPLDMKATPSAENYFRHEGGGWSIGFQGEKGIFTDLKYIRYIFMLLDRQGKEITCLELFRAADGNTFHAGIMSSGQSLDEGLSQNSIYKDQEVSMEKLKSIEQIRSEIDKEEDPLIIAELKHNLMKMEESLKEMNAIVDKEGKPVRRRKKSQIDDPHRKEAQNSVKTGLDDAYVAFGKAGLKKLVNHLQKHIKPDGNYDFRYSNTETQWDLKL